MAAGDELASLWVAGASSESRQKQRDPRKKGSLYPTVRHFYGERLQSLASAKGDRHC